MTKLTAWVVAIAASLLLACGASAQTKDWSNIKIATEGAYKPRICASG